MGKDNKSEVAILHKNTEELRYIKSSKTTQTNSDETMNLMYRLRESQLELSMQNKKLIQALFMAEDAIKLYDFTPAGNFTISKEGEIIKLNICGSQMLARKRLHLINSRFGFFVSDDTKPIFNLFIEKVFNNKAKESCEVTLSIDDNLPMYVHLIGIASENGEQCLVNMVDITERKQVELELALQIEEKAKWTAKLIIANKKLALQNVEKKKREAELIIANKELAFQNREKEKRADELIIANKELAFQNMESVCNYG